MRKLIVVVIFTFCTTLAYGQIFPGEENLDVLYLTDGTIMRGVVREDVPERYLEMEIYGGSTFVLSYENIERRDQEENPDYGTAWIKVDVGDHLAALLATEEPEPEEEEKEIVAKEREYGPFLGEGHVYSVKVGLGRVNWGGLGHREYFDDTLNLNEQSSMNLDFGASYTYMRQARPVVAPWWMWGTRLALGVAGRTVSGRADNPADDGDGERGRLNIRSRVLEAPFELLIGGGRDRFVGYAGYGVGLTIPLGEPRFLFEGEELDSPNLDIPVASFMRFTVGGLIRIDSNWSSHVDLYFHNQLTSWYSEFDLRYDVMGMTIGLGYHLR